MNKSKIFLPAEKHWKIGANPELGFDFFGLDSEGTGRQEVNLLVAPARLEFNDPDERVDLPNTWTVFTQIYTHDPRMKNCFGV